MGRSHAMCGLIVGVGAAGLLAHAPLPIRLLVIPVTGGAALLPDIDHPSSRVARSLGIVTKLISRTVAAASLAIYHATRTDTDNPARRSGHRTVTHTLPGCLAWGVMTLLALWVHPGVAATVLALLCGLLALGFTTLGSGFTALAGVGSWVVLTYYPGWWWVWPLAVTLGSWVHVLGDWVTNSGVPLWWPLQRGGRRWAVVHAPSTFPTNSPFETEVVTPALTLGLTLAGGFILGVPQWCWQYWAAHR